MVMLYYLLAVPLGVAVSHFSRESAAARTAVFALAGAQEKTEALVKGWLETLSLGLYSGASTEQAILDALASRAGHFDRLAMQCAIALVALSLLAVLAHGIAWQRARTQPGIAQPRHLARRAFLRQLFAVAAVCLGVGVTAPVLSVSAHADVMLLGEVVLQHDTKDIIGTVGSLANGGNLWLAAMVGLFSLLLPVAKLGLSWLAIDAEHPRLRATALRVVRSIGRWSMTDVFVVALLLTFFAAGAEAFTTAAVGIGLWFFAAYALLSLAGGIVLERESSLATQSINVPTSAA